MTSLLGSHPAGSVPPHPPVRHVWFPPCTSGLSSPRPRGQKRPNTKSSTFLKHDENHASTFYLFTCFSSAATVSVLCVWPETILPPAGPGQPEVGQPRLSLLFWLAAVSDLLGLVWGDWPWVTDRSPQSPSHCGPPVQAPEARLLTALRPPVSWPSTQGPSGPPSSQLHN